MSEIEYNELGPLDIIGHVHPILGPVTLQIVEKFDLDGEEYWGGHCEYTTRDGKEHHQYGKASKETILKHYEVHAKYEGEVLERPEPILYEEE